VLSGLREGLAQLGYREGAEIAYIVEDTKGDSSGLDARVARLLETQPQLLFTVSTSYTAAAKRGTTTIPIVFTLVGDPVGSGFIASYASSKNNLTGVTSYTGPLSGKRLELLKDLAPRTKRVLAVVTRGDSIAEISFRFLEETAKKVGVHVIRRDVATKEEIERALDETPRGAIDAIFLIPTSLTGSHIDLFIKKSKRDRIPLIVNERSWVDRGALASYGVDFHLLGVQVAKVVAKVLKGARPSEIRIETPDRFILAINLATAREIGLRVPPSVMERAEWLVE
jgi:putative ABC transport system substrate-binding protein